MEFDALYKIKVKMSVIDSSIFAMIIQWMQPARPFHRYRKWSQQNYLYYHDDTFRVWVFVWLHDDNCPLCLRGRGRCVYMGVPRLPCVMVEWCARIKYLDTLSATIFITMLAWTAAGQRARQRRPAICLHQTGIIHRRACAHASRWWCGAYMRVCTWNCAGIFSLWRIGSPVLVIRVVSGTTKPSIFRNKPCLKLSWINEEDKTCNLLISVVYIYSMLSMLSMDILLSVISSYERRGRPLDV